MTSYYRSIVVIGLHVSRTVSEISGDIRQNRHFPTPVYLTPPLKGFPLELGIVARGQIRSNDGATRWLKKLYALCISASRSKKLGPVNMQAVDLCLYTQLRGKISRVLRDHVN